MYPDLRQRNGTGVLPFFHIFGARNHTKCDSTLCLTHFGYVGAVGLILAPLRGGYAIVVQGRFEPIAFCANIEKYKIAFTAVVPPILVMLARHPGRSSCIPD